MSAFSFGKTGMRMAATGRFGKTCATQRMSWLGSKRKLRALP